MTTINKLEKALNDAKGLSSDLKTFSMDTDDQQAKQMFNQLATNLENVAQMLQSRIDYVNSEEPQYLQSSTGNLQQDKGKEMDKHH